MKLSFTFTLFVSGVAFAGAQNFLDNNEGSIVDDEALEFKREASKMAGAASLFIRGAILPAQIKRAKHLKAALLPMFESLPKNQHGKLMPQIARYALHRLFEQQHAWSVDGLQSTPSDLQKKENPVGELIANVLFADHASQGISMNSLVLIAMILEDRIHTETVAQLTTSYVVQNRSTGTEMPAAEMDALIDRYMTIYISGMREYDLNSTEYGEQKKFMETSTSDWDETTDWIHNAQHNAMRARKPCGHGITDCSFDFQGTTSIVEELMQNYGKFNHGECKRLKATLLEVEDRKTGRVSLADFYKKGMSGTWQFNEKADYLRDLGSLDESLPGQPRVIVANYVNSWVNCLTSSSLYSVCCSNECESLLGHLEHHIKSPTSKPERILDLVQSFKSDDLALVNVSQLLNSRLHQIAEKHQGKVPLHGRLFAQWLHHAFPQSCPFPHEAGATNPLTPDQWMKEKGHAEIKASEEEIRHAVESMGVANDGQITGMPLVYEEDMVDGESSVPWSDVEDVYVTHSQDKPVKHVLSWQKNAMVLAIQVLLVAGLVYGVSKYTKTNRSSKDCCFEKHVI